MRKRQIEVLIKILKDSVLFVRELNSSEGRWLQQANQQGVDRLNVSLADAIHNIPMALRQGTIQYTPLTDFVDGLPEKIEEDFTEQEKNYIKWSLDLNKKRKMVKKVFKKRENTKINSKKMEDDKQGALLNIIYRNIIYLRTVNVGEGIWLRRVNRTGIENLNFHLMDISYNALVSLEEDMINTEEIERYMNEIPMLIEKEFSKTDVDWVTSRLGYLENKRLLEEVLKKESV